ncbi:hypothetical protein EV356DRAFT_489331, partial [Viridothelium virens]
MDTPEIRQNSEAGQSNLRARELYQYFKPSAHKASIGESQSQDPVLTAHAQLVALRVNCERTMINFIDRTTIYHVAEATRALTIGDTNHDDANESCLLRRALTPKSGSLCANTIDSTLGSDGSPAHFEVLDLRHYPRYRNARDIRSIPGMRYYCGVPVYTNRGIAIGTLLVSDSRPRAPMSRANLDFLQVMAQNVMLHFEMQREKRLRQRAWNMNLCLATFVGLEQRPGYTKRGLKENFKTLRRSQDFDAGEGDKQLATFSRAAGLLGEALDLQSGGGVVFLDTFAAIGDETRSYQTQLNRSVQAPTQHEDQDFWVRDGSRISSRPQNQKKPSDTFLPLRPEAKEHAEILASFHQPLATMEPPGDTNAKSSRCLEAFIAPSPATLADLIRRHSRGKLFNMDELPETASEEIMGQDYFDLRKSDVEEEHEAELNMLRDHFPTARQIIFIPVQNFASSAWSVCFCYNMSEFRHFSSAFELPHSLAFCHCITTELGRLSILESSLHKSKFIGSISHELRSPLHGILASCDFMGEMGGSSFQRSIIDTASSCARTLMDTIDMVLDYSKINTFERDWRNVCKAGAGKPLKTTAGEGNPSMNIYSLVDIAKITEEVIEGSVTGSAMADSSRSIIGDTDHHRTPHQAGNDSSNSAEQARFNNTGRPEVEMIVDIPMIDWTYVTQPGSFRRIVMNLVGNALKYTKQGFIQVQLSTTQQEKRGHTPDEDNPISLITLKVTDSGCGISPEYLRTKLFTPFSQENSLAPGTGLGLSLVQSIVTMLDGEIDVKSQLNAGTQVTVQLPMRK